MPLDGALFAPRFSAIAVNTVGFCGEISGVFALPAVNS
jgi:hypothetical protein